MSRTIYLRVAYDGTEFHGWQRQPGLRTVQGVLEASARRVTRHDLELVGSGRTDAGVHASGQVASFVTTCAMPVAALRQALGARLPDDMSVVAAHEVDPGFHATRSAVSKLYTYRVYNTPARPVQRLVQRYTYHCWHRLDVARLRRAAAHMIGEMDFSALASKGRPRETMVRTVYRCDVERFGNEVRISVEGSGFLYNQVRNMVGTLLEVGRGRWAPDHVREILATRDRAHAGPTAPARGLCLRWVRYPGRLLAAPRRG
ncbi:MAG: tRNA pseudouridine(38-40) synthase TruA [Phycisphaerae bacterium]